MLEIIYQSKFHTHLLVFVKNSVRCSRCDYSTKYNYNCNQCNYILCTACQNNEYTGQEQEQKNYKVVNCHRDIEKYGSLQVIYSDRYFEEKDNT